MSAVSNSDDLRERLDVAGRVRAEHVVDPVGCRPPALVDEVVMIDHGVGTEAGDPITRSAA